MVKIILLLLLLPSWCQPLSPQSELEAIKISFSFPVPLKDGSIYQRDNSFKIYYFKHYTLFEFLNSFDSIEHDQLVFSEFRERYFLVEASKDTGFSYSPKLERYHKKFFKVDSLLNENALTSFNLHYALDSLDLVKSFVDTTAGLLEESYTILDSTITDSDTLTFFFDRSLNKIRYSFSPILDAKKKMKLYKIRSVNAASFDETHNVTIPKRVTVIELQKYKVDSPEKIFEIIRTMENEIRKLKQSSSRIVESS